MIQENPGLLKHKMQQVRFFASWFAENCITLLNSDILSHRNKICLEGVLGLLYHPKTHPLTLN